MSEASRCSCDNLPMDIEFLVQPTQSDYCTTCSPIENLTFSQRFGLAYPTSESL